MKKLGDESGQTLILVAVAMSTLLGFTAFATDVGVLLHQKRLAQTAADSAAIAGAGRLGYGSAAAQAAAQEDATSNGFTSGQNGATVTVTPSPGTGSFTGSTYVNVTVAQTVHTIFAGLFGRGSVAVGASATAGLLPSTGCVYVLAPSGNATLSLDGSFDVSTPGCGVIVNSSGATALTFVGGSGTLNAAYVNVVGGESSHSNDSVIPPTLGVAQISDPLADLKLPAYQSTLTTNCAAASPASGTSSHPTQLSPGCWSSNGNITLNNVTFAQSGVYTFSLPATGQLILSGNVSSGANAGVTLYLTNGSINATTNSVLSLTAPTSNTSGAFYTTDGSGNIISSASPGPFNGISIYIAPPAVIPVPPATPVQVIEFEKGSATGVLSGIIYAPGAEFWIHDSGSDGGNGSSGGGTTSGNLTLTTDIVTNTFLDNTGNLTVQSFSPTDPNSPLNRVTLVE